MDTDKEKYLEAKKHVVNDLKDITQNLQKNYTDKEKDDVIKTLAVALYYIISLDKLDEYSALMQFAEEEEF